MQYRGPKSDMGRDIRSRSNRTNRRKRDVVKISANSKGVPGLLRESTKSQDPSFSPTAPKEDPSSR